MPEDIKNSGKACWFKRKWVWLCGGSAMIVLSGSCVFLRIWSPSDILAYYGMLKNPAPMLGDLAFRRFKLGDSMSELLARHPNLAASNFGRFSSAGSSFKSNESNYTDSIVVAMDGKIIYADADGVVQGWAWEFTFLQATNFADLQRQFDHAVEQSINH